MFCGFDTLEGDDGKTLTGHPMLCKRWSCPTCQPIRCLQLRELATSGSPNVFITLTASDACGDDPDQIARMLVHSWRMVLQRGKREGKWSKPQYLAVFEETKRHRPHLHILWRGPYVDQQWISKRMDEYMDSPIVWVEAVKSWTRAARYVAKYISKSPWRWQGTKRYWRSQKWRRHDPAWQEERRRNGRWWYRLMQMHHNRIAELITLGYTVTEATGNRYVAIPPQGAGPPPLHPAT